MPLAVIRCAIQIKFQYCYSLRVLAKCKTYQGLHLGEFLLLELVKFIQVCIASAFLNHQNVL